MGEEAAEKTAGNFQISLVNNGNGSSDGGVNDKGGRWMEKLKHGKAGSRSSKRKSGDEILNDFIWANKDLVDKTILDRFCGGDKKAISIALNMIHFRSLQTRNESKKEPSKAPILKKTFVEVVKNSEEKEWTVVKNRKSKSNRKEQEK